MQERRSHQRNKTYLGGQVGYHRKCGAIECLVRNVSSDGARLVFSAPTLTPVEFDLTIPHKDQQERVTIVWRKGTEVGVRFLAA
jgi:hypothetical protein